MLVGIEIDPWGCMGTGLGPGARVSDLRVSVVNMNGEDSIIPEVNHRPPGAPVSDMMVSVDLPIENTPADLPVDRAAANIGL
jgi:hypothetical protein